MTPPLLFAAAVAIGEMPRRSAVMRWRLPKSTLLDVSLPVSATPNQPSSGEKNGNSQPVVASASFGHTTPQFTFPIGGYGSLRAEDGMVRLFIDAH